MCLRGLGRLKTFFLSFLVNCMRNISSFFFPPIFWKQLGRQIWKLDQRWTNHRERLNDWILWINYISHQACLNCLNKTQPNPNCDGLKSCIKWCFRIRLFFLKKKKKRWIIPILHVLIWLLHRVGTISANTHCLVWFGQVTPITSVLGLVCNLLALVKVHFSLWCMWNNIVSPPYHTNHKSD